MNKTTTLFIITFLLFNLFMVIPEPLTISKQMRALRFDNNTNLTYSDSSFIGENAHDWAGISVAGGGDVNGDGYDDILIGAWDHSGGYKGKVYLILGKGPGWSMDINLSKADASFVGEYANDFASYVAIAGDVNNDSYDDILIAAPYNDDGGLDAGKVYLIFGKATGWSNNTNLSTADASFVGEAIDDMVYVVAGAGDVNGDGYDDILIGAEENDESGTAAGQAYLIFGKASGWSKNKSLSNSNASFQGEINWSFFGEYIASAGDVNDDGYDDIMIWGMYDDSIILEDRVYLIYGKATGWAMDINISNADVTFYERNLVSGSLSMAGAGDVNGDGIDDIIIGASGNCDAAIYTGKTYLIFGQTSGWSKRTSLSTIDITFIGERIWDKAGAFVCGGGDVNGDGYDDVLISTFSEHAWPRDNMRKNEIYLVLGKTSGWSENTSLAAADASFVSENFGEEAGWGILIAGDVNGDGYDDILISAMNNDEGGNNSGQIYLIFTDLDIGPNTVNSVKVYSDASFTNEINNAGIDDTVYVELIGTDKNASHFDNAAVNISSSISSPEGFTLYLLETGFNTGRYRGSFKISDRTHPHLKFINATIGENVTISSVTDPSKNTTIFIIRKVQLKPLQDETIAIEDEEYFMHYWNFGANVITEWTFETNSSWLSWDEVNHILYGTPNNGDVGTYWVRINITDGLGNFDEHNFTLTVNNTPPEITTEDVVIAREDEQYYVDYTSTDDGQGIITWYLKSNASWLAIYPSLGVVSGTPTNSDRGTYEVNVSVNDGNGGIDWSYFEITVLDTNDAPVIITENVTAVFEDQLYSVQYNAADIDGNEKFEWYLDTNASWLNMNRNSGKLSGTPTNDDVGFNYVNITVSDSRNGTDYQNFTLEVHNVNDPPKWITVPPDTEVPEGYVFNFDVNATDVDSGDVLNYYIESKPDVNIKINSNTGMIEWLATIENLTAPQYAIEVILRVTDGKVSINNWFKISVKFNPRPNSQLISPLNDSFVSVKGTELKWEGNDKEDETLNFDVYLSNDLSSVSNLEESARIIRNTNNTSFVVYDLNVDVTYYWTVIPSDWLNYGECVDGIFNFIINSPPEIKPISMQKATVGDKFELEIEASDSNQDDIKKFKYSLESAPEGMSINFSTGIITWTPTKDQVGQHTIEVWVSDELDQTNSSFEIKVSEKLMEDTKTSSFVVTTISFIMFIVIINLFISTTEVGKYKFLSLFFIPLYNRLHPDNIFDNYARGRIHGYIEAKPGEHYNAIKKALKLNNGTLAHHAKILEKEGYIYSERDGFRTRFYPKGMKKSGPETIQQSLIEIIRQQPGISQHEIISLLDSDSSQQVISYNLIKLTRNGTIKLEHKGRKNRYSINYDDTDSYPSQD